MSLNMSGKLLSPTNKWLEYRISDIEIFYCDNEGWRWEIICLKADGSSRCFDYCSNWYDTPQKAFNAAIKILKREGLVE